MLISEVTAVPLLLLIGLISFRVALCRLKRMNIDYGVVLGIADYHLYPGLLQLHTHRLALYTIMCSICDQFVDSRIANILLATLPIAYILALRDPLVTSIKRNLVQALLMTRRDVDLGLVIFSDGLTSYARLLPIVGGFMLQDVVRDAYVMDVVCAVLVAVPFWVRMRQCLQEANGVHGDSMGTGKPYAGDTMNQRAAVNALRYATNFPVIFLALHATQYPRSWIAMTIFNQAFSAIWDCSVDWSLKAMSRVDLLTVFWMMAVRVVWTLRAVYPLLYTHHLVHYAVVGLEVCRRMAWLVLRLQSHIYQHDPTLVY